MVMINHQFQRVPFPCGFSTAPTGSRLPVLLVDDNADLRYNDDGRFGVVFLP
jgi:hypothetical protein